MEVLYIVLLLGLFLFINQQFVALKQALAEQRHDLWQLKKDLLGTEQPLGKPAAITTSAEIAQRIVPETGRPNVPDIPQTATPIPAPVLPESRPVAPPKSEPLPDLEPVLSISTPDPPKLTKPNLLDPSLLETPSTFATAPADSGTLPPAAAEPTVSWYRRFLNENPDLEKFIGENLINKIGIAILVVGIGYFVRYAIAQEWIGEVGRVLIGVVAGGGLLAVAHRLRERFAAFSSVLVAGGLSVLYFTIAIAFSDYKLFSQTATFGIMVVITAFAVLLSIAYNRQELAVMSLIGGFATPFMVSTGQSNYVVLFTYILILDVGMLVLSAFKRWPLVHWVAYGFTILLFGAWLSTDILNIPDTVGPGHDRPRQARPPYIGTFVFGTLFYALFVARNLFDRLRADHRFTATDTALFLSNTALYYGAGMAILENVDKGSWQGVFTLALAVVNFGYAALLFRPSTTSTLIYLLIGLVITFASLTIPVQLEGNYITMFWALEAVLLLWLGQRSGLRLITTSSVVVLFLMLMSLLMDWSQLYNGLDNLPILLNEAFITSVVSLVGLGAYYGLLKQQPGTISLFATEVSPPAYRRFVGYLALGVGYIAGWLETDYQLSMAFPYSANAIILLGTYNLVIAVVILFVSERFATPQRRAFAGVIGVLAVLYYALTLAPAVPDLLDWYQQGRETSRVGFPFHYVNLGLLALVLVGLFRVKNELAGPKPWLETTWPWFLVATVVYAASWSLFANAIAFHFDADDIARTPAELVTMEAQYNALARQVNKVGLPILWGVCAFVFMYVGLVRRNRTYRVLSLGLFALTLTKLFLYDIRGISEGGRIAAFISLGALLLVISFMYQRIKRLLLADEVK